VSEQTPGLPGEIGGSAEFSIGSLIAGYRFEERIGHAAWRGVRRPRRKPLMILRPSTQETCRDCNCQASAPDAARNRDSAASWTCLEMP